MATMNARISDELLDRFVEQYKDTDPIMQSHSFSIYLALSELKRLRAHKPEQEG